MRLFRRSEDRHGVDDPDYRPPLPPAPGDEDVDGGDEEQGEQYAISPAGRGIAVVGAGLLALSVFLPLDESRSALAQVQKNTLIQQEEWLLLVAGAVIALAALATNRGIAICVLGLLAGGLVAYYASEPRLHTLYSLGTNGEANESTGTRVPFGIALYIAGAGAALSVIGGWVMFRSREAITSAAPDRPTRQCPDCAETILAEAHVCRYCGYRFDTERG
jgi:hypothetical protein